MTFTHTQVKIPIMDYKIVIHKGDNKDEITLSGGAATLRALHQALIEEIATLEGLMGNGKERLTGVESYDKVNADLQELFNKTG